MWISDIFTGQNALPLIYLCIMLYNFDSPATARRYRFQNPQRTRISLSLLLKQLKVLRKQVTHRRNQKVLRELNPQPVHISPEQVFPTELGRPWEVICLLIFVEHFDVVRVDVTRPLHVEVLVVAFDHVEAGVFARVNHCIVDVCRILNLERHKEVVDLVAIILANTIGCPLEMHVARVWEKCSWRPVIEYRL